MGFEFNIDNFVVFFGAELIFFVGVWGIVKALKLVRN
jgi:hypothetical protein